MTQALAALSASIEQLVVSAAPLLAAIRTSPNHHVTGLVCQRDVIITPDQALPLLDSYTVVLPNRPLVAARPGPRDPRANLAMLHLDSPCPLLNPEIATAAVGSLVVVLGADADASPTVRLTTVHRFVRTADGPIPVLDLTSDGLVQGSLVLDPSARLVGLVALGPNQEVMVIPSANVSRMLIPDQHARTSPPAAVRQVPANRRGWLGVALQPIVVPNQLVAWTGQTSGRMVVNVTKGGPAEVAGMRVGDVLLALDDTSASGP